MFKFLKTLLSKVPFLGTAVSWVLGNTRTVIEYGLVCVLMVVGGTAITLWFRTQLLEDKAETLQKSLATEQLVNELQNDALDTYRDIRERDAKALSTVVGSMNVLVSRNATQKEKLTTLEKNNAVVKDALSVPVPSSINCLYNPTTCDENGAKGESGKASDGIVHPLQRAK